jgi:3-oxo-5-alpha-steroid 4-dehydrogenase 1
MAVFLSIWGPRQFTPTFWLGIAGWALGFFGNGTSIKSHGLMIVYHDEILNDLRRSSDKRLITAAGPEEEKDKKVGNGRYAIPRGSLFGLVSFPNYLCEW